MTDDRWLAVDAFIAERIAPDDTLLAAAVDAGARAGLPPIQVSAPHGKLLHLLARAMSARRILEIGTLAGYSAIWLARSLPPDGRLVTLELDPHHADVARESLQRAGLADLVEVMVGPAVEALAQLVDGGIEPFDMVFIDADKEGYPDYLDWSLRLTRPGSLIVADNVVRGGAVVDEGSDNSQVRGVRRFLELLATDDRVDATVVQTVGAKGYDGLAIARVR